MNYYSQFVIKTAKLKDGQAPIYLKITVAGKASEVSINKSVSLKLWDQYQSKKNVNSEELEQFRIYLKTQELKLEKIYINLIQKEIVITSSILKENFQEKDTQNHTIQKAIDHYLIELKTRGVQESSFTHFRIVRLHITKYLQSTKRGSDIFIGHINREFIINYKKYLIDNGMSVNTANKNLNRVKAVIKGVRKMWKLTEDPFEDYSAKWQKVEKRSLTQGELNKIISTPIEHLNTDRFRDLFLFSCYTGLGYSEIYNLSADHIVIDMNGKKCINIPRQKTKVTSFVLLIPQALEILKKYKGDPRSRNGGLLPVPDNSNYNKELKILGAVCFPDKPKKLTTHAARHTFAQLSLNSGIDSKSISAAMGHSTLKELSTYATVQAEKVNNDYGKFLQVAL